MSRDAGTCREYGRRRGGTRVDRIRVSAPRSGDGTGCAPDARASYAPQEARDRSDHLEQWGNRTSWGQTALVWPPCGYLNSVVKSSVYMV